MAQSPLYDIFDPEGELQGQLPEYEFDELGNLRKKRRSIADLLPDEQKQSMLSDLAQTGTSALGAVGYALDTPGAYMRGLLAGKPGERITGRDLLRSYGMIGDEDNWYNFIGGLAAEFVTDPLTVLNPFASIGRGALSTAGKAAKAASLLDNAVVMADDAGKGIRQFYRQSPRSVIESLGDDAAKAKAYEDFSNAAKGLGANSDDILDQQMAGLMEFRLPWSKRGRIIDLGPTGSAVASGLDYLGQGARSAPVIGQAINRFTAAFDPAVQGAIDPADQMVMRRSTAATRQAERAELERLANLQYDALQANTESLPADLNNFFQPRVQNAIRDLVEAGGVTDNLIDQDAVNAILNVPQWKAVYDDFARRGPEFYQRSQDLGLELANWRGKSGDMFFPSQSVWFDNPDLPDLANRVSRTEKPYSRGSRMLNLDDNFSRSRRAYTDLDNRAQTFRKLMAGEEGRELQQRLIAADDAAVPGIIDKAFSKMGREAPFERGIKELREALDDPSLIPADRRELTRQLNEAIAGANRNKLELANLLRKADRQFADRNMGLFDNSAFDDMTRYSVGRARVEANARVVTDQLLRAAVDAAPDSIAGGGFVPLAQAAKELGFDPGLFKKAVAANKGQDITNLAVSEKTVAALKKLRPTTAVEESSAIGNLWDSYTNAFKAVTLANPAYHFRNLYSGQFSTLTGGGIGNPFQSLLNAYRGRLAGKGDYSGVLAALRKKDAAGNVTWAAPGFEGLSDEDIVRKALAGMARNRLGGGEVGEIVGEQATSALFPGTGGRRVPWFGEGGLLWDPKRRLSDWLTVRGVNFRGALGDTPAPKRTINPLLDLHERTGQSVEDMNRIGAYLNQIQRGVSPDAAADAVFRTQVDYSPRAFTDFERKLKRFVPFYSYPRGIAPLVAENILQRPGGLQTQSIRAVVRGTEGSDDSFVPEHLRASAAIPLPEALGGKPADNLQRFMTNIDLPYEGLINLVTPGVGLTPFQVATDTARRTGMSLAGQLNPLLKVPLEFLVNRQFYTGRELTDLYSFLEDKGLGDYGPSIEQVANIIPGGTRAMGIARQLTDDRLPTLNALAKAVANQTLGVKFTDIDQEKTKQFAARNLLTQLLDAQPGVRSYQNLNIPEEDLRNMPREQQEMYLLYRVMQSEAAQRAREKKKAEADPLAAFGL